MKNRILRYTAGLTALLIAAGTYAVPAFAAGTGQYTLPDQAASSVLAARSVRERDSQSMNSRYLLPDSDTYYITEADVSWMNDTELMLARNEFYARRGRKFVTTSIRDYFNRQAWYTGWIEPDDFRSEMFNRYEQANVDFIVAYENRRKEVREQKQREESLGLYGVNPTADDMEYYGEIRDLYTDAVSQKWSREEYELAGMNGMVSELQKPGDLGFTCRDLDGDSRGEFLIGPTSEQLYGEGAVFEIYTLQDGHPVEVIGSDDSCRYYVCSDNSIRMERISPAGAWEILYYDMVNGNLVCRDGVMMDESRNAENPWFVINDAGGVQVIEYGSPNIAEGVSSDIYSAVSSEDAAQVRAAHVADSLQLQPVQE